MLNKYVSTLFELVGVALVAAGFWALAPWAGLIAAGAGFILVGLALSMSAESVAP